MQLSREKLLDNWGWLTTTWTSHWGFNGYWRKWERSDYIAATVFVVTLWRRTIFVPRRSYWYDQPVQFCFRRPYAQKHLLFRVVQLQCLLRMSTMFPIGALVWVLNLKSSWKLASSTKRSGGVWRTWAGGIKTKKEWHREYKHKLVVETRDQVSLMVGFGKLIVWCQPNRLLVPIIFNR